MNPGVRKKRISPISLLPLWSLLALPAAAQTQGPLPPPQSSGEPGMVTSGAAPAAKPEGHAESAISNAPPSLPVEQIIRKFTQHESEMRQERNDYTYSQTFVVQSVDDDGRAEGEYRLSSDILFTPDGKRYEKVTYAPGSTLTKFELSKEDFDDLKNLYAFVLPAEDLHKYNVTYVGRQIVDELPTYVFDVAPKTIEKDQRYFQGRLWVDDRDLQVVKTYGTSVFVVTKKNRNSRFPHFTTYRENISGPYWFPTYTHADEVLQFPDNVAIHGRFSVRYANYKRFGSTHKLGTPVEVKQ